MIGLHKGVINDKSYGILTTTQNNKAIISIARDLSISDPSNQSEVALKLKKTEDFLKQSDQKEKKTGLAFFQENDIIWKTLPKKANSLQSLMCKIDDDSFSNSVKKIRVLFRSLLRQKFKYMSLLGEKAISTFFSIIQKASLSANQQDQYFKILQDFVDVELGYRNETDEYEFCGKIAERLSILHGKVFAKTDENIVLDRNQTIQKMNQKKLIKKRDQIISKLNKEYTPAIKQQFRNKKKIERQFYYFLKLKKLKGYPGVFDYIEGISKQDSHFLYLKSEIMKVNGRFIMSKGLLGKWKKKIESKNNGNKTVEYADCVKSFGQLLRLMGSSEKSLECFNQNLRIQEQIKGQKSLEYAEALYLVSSFYVGKRNNPENLKKGMEYLKKAIEIIQKNHSKNYFELSKYLANLGLAHFYRNEITKSLNLSKRSLQILKKTKDENCFQQAEIHNNIGSALMKISKFKEAKQHFIKSLEIQEIHRGKNNLFYPQIMNNIGYLCMMMEEMQKAEEYLNQSIFLYDSYQDVKNESGKAQVLLNLACLYEKQKNFDKARDFAEESLNLFMSTLGKEHKSVQSAKAIYERCQKKKQ